MIAQCILNPNKLSHIVAVIAYFFQDKPFYYLHPYLCNKITINWKMESKTETRAPHMDAIKCI